MNFNRRQILKGASSLALAGGSLSHLSFAATSPRQVLVVIFLRGGADSLNLLAPTDDKNYVEARSPELRVLSQGEKAGLRLPKPITDADWRLHPACAPLLELFQSNHAQVLHACGLQNATRSHFEAQEILESSSSKAMNLAPGWLSNFVTEGSTLGAVATNNGQVRAITGAPNSMNLGGELRSAVSLPWDEQGRKVLEALYGSNMAKTSASGGREDALLGVGQSTLKLLSKIDAKLPRTDGKTLAYSPPPSVKYNNENGEWANACQTVAQLIRLDLGLQVACLDFGGWDTHEGQAGRINNLARQWSTNVRALFDDISASGHQASFVVMSEFGRRLKANASGGTDHGHGGALWAFDTAAKKLLPSTKWPGLSIPELDQGLDLKSTVDVKTVLSDIAKTALS